MLHDGARRQDARTGRAGRTGAARGLISGAAAGAVAVAVVAGMVAACGTPTERPVPRSPVPAGSGGPEPVDGLRLAVGDDGRHLVDEQGEPFFWLGDTAWSMPVNLDRDEVVAYLDTRAEQGYNVVQTVAIFPQAGGPGPNRYGDRPFQGGLGGITVTEGADPGDDTQYDYWDHIDFVVSEAAARDIRVALLPAWSDKQVGELLTEDNAAAYGAFLGERYGDQVIWVMGGDDTADDVEDVWRELARGIAVGATGAEDYGTTLMTFHPLGDRSSVEWFHDDEWLDFNMIQGGHCLRYDVRRELVDDAYGANPPKPFIDGEPIYEEHPYCWKPEDGFSTPADVRRDAYWAVFGGAAGHTYGHHSVWQFTNEDRPPRLGARGDWESALDDEAAGQMRHLAALMEGRDWWTGVPDQSIVTSDVGEGPSRLQATRAADGAYAMVYSPDGAPFDADLSVLAGGTARLSWFDPRTGESADAGTAPAGGSTFTPPSREDWVLVAEPA
ncbi:MAG TPA: glycoside hydrolase family 140 protein [Pseudonocardia sp.]|nr:glycoside hydrolase family 140 protein [Pseudonocardia sp.]